MNTTITNIATTTTNDSVRNLAAKMVGWANKRVRIQFAKKDGTIRNMVAIFRDNWNAMNDILSTPEGRKMIATKCAKGMATVTEILEDGRFQPRTINLNTVTKMELV